MFFKKLKEIPEENKALHAKIDELNAAVRLIIEVWLIFHDSKNNCILGEWSFEMACACI